MIFKSQLEDSIPPKEYNNLVSNLFWHQLDKLADRELFIDFESERKWLGKDIKRGSRQIAEQLINLAKFAPNSDCVFFYKNCDYIQVAALGVLFAGGSVCVGEPEDPEREQSYMVEQMQPSVVFICFNLLERMRSVRTKLGLNFALVVMDDSECGQVEFGPNEFGLHKHLLVAPSGDCKPLEAPVQVDPDRAAFVLLTSGSTGRPKAVARTQKNSLWVCYLLPQPATAHLWDLNENSVMAGHLQLDHGTGTFCLKMTLAKGHKLVIMERYDQEKMLQAIDKYKISDCVLGSALLHNLVSDQLEADAQGNNKWDLSSLRNFLSVGSPIASYQKNELFMKRYPQCCIRQAFGMTECGFMAINERDLAQRDTQTVGPLVPNLEVKLVDCETGRPIEKVNEEGLLYVRGPTVSPGYMFAQFKEQAAQCFLPDGFYVSSDICLVRVQPHDPLARQRLQIRGRANDMLYLLDGWKVLPSEIEQVLMEHPQVQEAAVVGVPHPELPTCHAPRAYVVLNKHRLAAGQKELTEKELFEFVARQTSEPKHLVGGIKFMKELPRISIGKVDRKLLKKQDGFL